MNMTYFESVIKERTACAALSSEQGAYFADHWNIKEYSKAGKLTKKNLGLLKCFSVKAKEESVSSLMANSTNLQQMFVGLTHGLALRGTILHSLFSNSAGVNGSLFTWTNSVGIILALWEIYENPLGGYDKGVYTALTELSKHLNGGKPELTIEELGCLLSGGGLNGTLVGSILDMCVIASTGKKLLKSGGKVKKDETIDEDIKAIALVSEIMFEVSKATFDFEPVETESGFVDSAHVRATTTAVALLKKNSEIKFGGLYGSDFDLFADVICPAKVGRLNGFQLDVANYIY